MTLGPPINRPLPVPDAQEWFPVPGRPELLRNARGQLRTNLPDPRDGRRPVPVTPERRHPN